MPLQTTIWISETFCQKSQSQNVLSIQVSINMLSTLKKIKKLPYRPIYSLALVECEIFQTYIKTYLTKSFI